MNTSRRQNQVYQVHHLLRAIQASTRIFRCKDQRVERSMTKGLQPSKLNNKKWLIKIIKHHNQQLLLHSNTVLMHKRKKERDNKSCSSSNKGEIWRLRNNGKLSMTRRWNYNWPMNRKKLKRLLLKQQKLHKLLNRLKCKPNREDKLN